MVHAFNDSFVKSALFLITSMSPSANSSKDLESYRETVYSDEVQSSTILDTAFLALIKDLETIGLILDIDPAEILDDQEGFMNFLVMASYLLPESLYNHLSKNSELRESCRSLLTGATSDNDVFITVYLSDLAGLNDHPALVPEIVECIEHYLSDISQTDIFIDYFKNVFSLVDTQTLLPESDEDTHTRYRLVVRDFVSRFMEAVSLFEQEDQYDNLVLIQNQLIMDFVSPNNFTAYSYIFLNDKTTLPQDLVPGFEKRVYEYQVSNPWCSPYYQVRKSNPGPASILAMLCFVYAWYRDPQEINDMLDTVTRMYPNTFWSLLKTHVSETTV